MMLISILLKVDHWSLVAHQFWKYKLWTLYVLFCFMCNIVLWIKDRKYFISEIYGFSIVNFRSQRPEGVYITASISFRRLVARYSCTFLSETHISLMHITCVPRGTGLSKHHGRLNAVISSQGFLENVGNSEIHDAKLLFLLEKG